MTIATTIISPAVSATPAPLIHRILAAHRLAVSARRPVALLLLAELTQLGAPTHETLRCWSQIGWLLQSCGCAEMASRAHAIWAASLAELCAGRPRSRVIEATCRVVA